MSDKLNLFEMALLASDSGDSNYADLQNKPSINSVVLTGNKTLSDLGIYNKTLRPMKSEWTSGSLTAETAANMILSDPDVSVGDGYLATVNWSDLSDLDMGCAEVKAFVISDSIVQFEMTSSDTFPYAWFFNSAGGVWRSYYTLESLGGFNPTKTQVLKSVNGTFQWVDEV